MPLRYRRDKMKTEQGALKLVSGGYWDTRRLYGLFRVSEVGEGKKG